MPKKLLLADDSVVIQKLVGLSFANEDVEIISTDNGDDAIAQAREVIPDVVLADVVMPGKSGYDVCEEIKNDPALAHVPVLLLTGTFEAFDEARAQSSGANGQITKPFEAQALVTRVTEVMNAPPPAPPVTPSPTEDAGSVEPPVTESDLFDANVTSLASSRDPLVWSDSPEQEAAVPDVLPHELPNAEPSTSLADAMKTDAPSNPLPAPTGVARDEDDFFLDEPDESRSVLFGPPRDVMSNDEGSADSSAGDELARNPLVADEMGATPGGAPSWGIDSDVDETPSIDVTEPPAYSDQPPALPSSPGSLETPPPLPTSGPRAIDPLQDFTDEFGLHEREPSPAETPSPPASAMDVDSALAAGQPGVDATIMVGRNDSNAATSRAMVDVPDSPLDAVTSDPNDGRESAASADSHEPPSMVGPEGGTSASVTNLDERLETSPSDEFAPPQSHGPSGLLDLGPSNVAGDDLDFAFDVSEQQPPEEIEDPLEQSYSSLAEIPDSPLGGPREEAGGEPQMAADYDVSSSDIATAPANPIQPPALPRSYDTLDSSSPTSEGGPTSESISDELISVASDRTGHASDSGSPAEDSFSAPPAEDSFSAPPAEDSFSASPAEDSLSASPAEDSFSAPPAEDSYSAPPTDGLVSDSWDRGADSVQPTDDSRDGVGEEASTDDNAWLNPSAREASQSDSSQIDLSPMMEQQIQESLERVAWDAFSDLSESIVKQVMDRVEKIAWEVIPQMAETLVREEIRRMKGEDD